MSNDAQVDFSRMLRVEDVVKIDTDSVLPTEEPIKMFNYVGLENIESVSGSLVGFAPTEGERIRSNKFVFTTRHVLLGKLRPYLNKVHLPSFEGICSTDILPLLPREGLLEREFLALCLRSSVFVEYSRAKMQGTKMPRLRTKDLKAFEIPVPPLEEQRRIVSRIEALTRRAAEARRLTLEREDELDTFLKAAYLKIIQRAEWKPLNAVASLVRRKVDTQPDRDYEEMGVRSFGKGTFKKPILTGLQLGSKRVYHIDEGDLVFNNVFSWEGAIAVAQPEDHGRVGSHRFITYVPLQGEATSEFLCHHFLSHRGLEDIRAASPGSAGRNRTLGLKKLEKINVPVPDYEEQVRFQEIAKRRREIRKKSGQAQEALTAYQAAVIAKAFRGEL